MEEQSNILAGITFSSIFSLLFIIVVKRVNDNIKSAEKYVVYENRWSPIFVKMSVAALSAVM